MKRVEASSENDVCKKWLSNIAPQHLDIDQRDVFAQKIQEHKWFLSEKIGRDVGCKVAAVDLLENTASFELDPQCLADEHILKAMGGQKIDPRLWETISDSQPPKQIVNKRIILPMIEDELARKHAVTPPRTILFFGPPGTGKTHFVQAIASALQWWFIELSPSTLIVDGEDRLGANLKHFLEEARDVSEVVLFIDEFEEIAASRDQASRIEKSITNEFLKQIPLFKAQPRRNLLVCATNYIRQLDAALMRPGRFDCIIPVGGLDDESRRRIFDHYLGDQDRSLIDVAEVIRRLSLFTPADIQYLFQKVRQTAFETEHERGGDGRGWPLTTQMFLKAMADIRPTLTEEILQTFNRDCAAYTRY